MSETDRYIKAWGDRQIRFDRGWCENCGLENNALPPDVGVDAP